MRFAQLSGPDPASPGRRRFSAIHIPALLQPCSPHPCAPLSCPPAFLYSASLLSASLRPASLRPASLRSRIPAFPFLALPHSCAPHPYSTFLRSRFLELPYPCILASPSSASLLCRGRFPPPPPVRRSPLLRRVGDKLFHSYRALDHQFPATAVYIRQECKEISEDNAALLFITLQLKRRLRFYSKTLFARVCNSQAKFSCKMKPRLAARIILKVFQLNKG